MDSFQYAYLIETKDVPFTNTNKQPSMCILTRFARIKHQETLLHLPVPKPPAPHLPRKRIVPSTRVPPTNTTRAIRVPLLTVLAVSMLLPISASIRRDAEATRRESRFCGLVASLKSLLGVDIQGSLALLLMDSSKTFHQEISPHHPFSNSSSQVK